MWRSWNVRAPQKWDLICGRQPFYWDHVLAHREPIDLNYRFQISAGHFFWKNWLPNFEVVIDHLIENWLMTHRFFGNVWYLNLTINGNPLSLKSMFDMKMSRQMLRGLFSFFWYFTILWSKKTRKNVSGAIFRIIKKAERLYLILIYCSLLSCLINFTISPENRISVFRYVFDFRF